MHNISSVLPAYNGIDNTCNVKSLKMKNGRAFIC